MSAAQVYVHIQPPASLPPPMSSSSITLPIGDDLATPQDLLQPRDLLPHAPASEEDNLVIAPWLGPPEESVQAPPLPPKPHLKSGFFKSPFPSLYRQQSTSSLSHSISRRSDVGSTTDLVESPRREPRKPKSISNIKNILKPRSRSRLRSDYTLPDEPVPPLPSSDLLPISPTSNSISPSTLSNLQKKGKKPSNLSPRSPLPDTQHEYRLDTDIEKMDGIIDFSVLSSAPDSGSPHSGGFDHSSSDVSSVNKSLGGTSSNIFSNPFGPSSHRTLAPSVSAFDGRKISPTTRPPDFKDDDSPSWTPPQSWAYVEKEGETTPPIAEESDTDENEGNSTARVRVKDRRRSGRRLSSSTTYKVRIYRADGTYHVVSISLSVTVDELSARFIEKIAANPDREPHKLYLRERGKERVLASTERPANIVRRRLEQAGYEHADGLEMLGAEDLTFLMRFVYKSDALGPVPDDLHIDTFDLIDLTGRSLRMVPVLLYPHADAIVSLNLSRNPMLEIPLDFIQSCSSLRELRLSHMAIKKVPQSVRHCRTLHRLDLSCNRIADLDDAGLDWIPELRSLKLQNNRMEKLPWYFPRLRALKDLNISNNKFRTLPSVVTEITSLVDLDISFNMIDKLPDNIGHLHALERLVIIGNRVSEFPEGCSDLVKLRMLDCRRNHISDLSIVCMLPKVQQIVADHNMIHAFDVSFGPCLKHLDTSHNDITQLTLIPGPLRQPYTLTSLDLSHAKLSTLDERALAQFTALETLRFDHNSIRWIPDSLGDLSHLVHLSCSNNQLRVLPDTIGRLQRLEVLEAHNNSLAELPGSLWNCASLQLINVTSNLVSAWRLPPMHSIGGSAGASSLSVDKTTALPARSDSLFGRKMSGSGSVTTRALPPLVFSLERLCLGENRLTDDALHPLALLQELRVLNLSFNDIQEMPPSFFGNLTKLRELYLSGNKLSALPTEDLLGLTKLEVLYLNGNKLQTLPKELGKLANLTVLDVGSNALKYNIYNWDYDWNWNFNTSLQYLNLSGNKRLQIRPDMSGVKDDERRKVLADFTGLSQLRILGLMDVTATNGSSIPDENEDRRVRISLSEVNGMGYGIADTLGATEHLNMLDLVQPNFCAKSDEAIFAMFGRASHIGNNHWLNKYLQSHFVSVYAAELKSLKLNSDEIVEDALRRAFLKLNRHLHDYLYQNAPNRKMSHVSTSTSSPRDLSKRSGASGIVLHLVGKTLYVANIGQSLAVISHQGNAELLSKKHDPFDRQETARIRSAEGWISPKGLVNDEIDVARSFGFYYLLPVVNSGPYICVRELTEQDEFVIIGNSGLWDHVSYQTAVDIARTEQNDPMIAAQKLRDLAISHGAEGTTMIMVIAVADLFRGPARSRQPTMESVIDAETYSIFRRGKKREIIDRGISRLDGEVAPPIHHLALVFTDIRNSTHLWEVNAGMTTAMFLHNNLLRRQLRFCGGYEVKTEGDAFMCSFPTAMSALWWCLSVQVQLLHLDWPLEILECEDGKEIFDSDGKLIARGLSVRMGVHCGSPFCEPDPITGRMDYFGPVVNRASRISGCAAGGQIMCSAEIVRELKARVFRCASETEQSHLQPQQAIEAIQRLDPAIFSVGEVKLKGLEAPEMLTLIYPRDLVGRHGLKTAQSESNNSSASRVQFSIEQMRELALLCIRLEMLSSGKVLRSALNQGSRPSSHPAGIDSAVVQPHEVRALLPAMDKASDAELMCLLDSLATRIDNALTRISLNHLLAFKDRSSSEFADPVLIQQLLSIIRL